jgi:pimeloyl-ACP methyl ester carboxylesterase
VTSPTRAPEPRQATVLLPAGVPALAVRITDGDPAADGDRSPFVLVHGLASNARTWDAVARALAGRGHTCYAVDQRGHGLSQEPSGGYDTDTCAGDLAALIDVLDLTGARRPIVVGQSWGGNVVLALAAAHDTVAAVGCVDGGWIRPAGRFATFADCWAQLAPPDLSGRTYDEVAELIRREHPQWSAEGVAATLANLHQLAGGGVRARLDVEHHRTILRSLFEGDPRAWYPQIAVPVLLVAAVPPPDQPDPEGRGAQVRNAVAEAMAALPRGRLRWYPGADHDIHVQQPEALGADLVALAAEASARNR